MLLPPSLGADKNKIATFKRVGHRNRDHGTCGFVVAAAWPARYCRAPAAPGSIYCLRHRALCVIAPDRAAGLAARRRLDHADGVSATVADAFGDFEAELPPELDDEEDAREVAYWAGIAIWRETDGEEEAR